MRKISIKRVLSALLTVAILSVSVFGCVFPMTALASTLPPELATTVAEMENFLKTGPFVAEDFSDAQIIYNKYLMVDETIRNSASDARIDIFVDVYNKLKSGADFVDNFEGKLAWQVDAKFQSISYKHAVTGVMTRAQDTRQTESTEDPTATGFWGIVGDTQNHALTMRKNFTTKATDLDINYNKDHYLINSVKTDYIPSNAELFRVSADMYYNSASATEGVIVTNYTSEHNWTGIFLDGTSVKKIVSNYESKVSGITLEQNVTTIGSLSNVLGNPVSFKAGQWLSVQMTFDQYDKVYMFKISGLDNSSAEVTAEFTVESAKMINKLAFASRTVAGSPMVDNVTAYQYGRDCYPMILDSIPDLDVLTIKDAEKLSNIRAFVNGLTGLERYELGSIEKLVAAEARLDELLSAAAGSGLDITSLDFEDPSHIEPMYSLNLKNKSNLYISSNKVQGNGNDSDNVLVFRPDQGSSKFMLSPFFQGSNTLYEVTFKTYFRQSVPIDIIYDYVDEDNYAALRLTAYKNELKAAARKCSQGKEGNWSTVTYLPVYYQDEASTRSETTVNHWFTFNLTYLEDGVHFAIKNMHNDVGVFVGCGGTGSPTVSKSFYRLELSKPSAPKFAIKTGAVNQDFYFDDFSFKYKDTVEHKRVSELMFQYGDIIHFDDDTISLHDKPIVDAVANAYNSYDEATKKYMPFMADFLKPLQAALASAECAEQTIEPIDPANVERRIDPETGLEAYVFKDDFEDGIRRWQNVGDTYKTESAWINLPTEENPDNMALAVKGINPAIGVKDEYLALENYKLLSRTFTMKINTDNWDYYSFVSAYADDGNFTYSSFRNFKDRDGYPYLGKVVTDYNDSQFHYFYSNELPKETVLTFKVKQTFNYENNRVVTVFEGPDDIGLKMSVPMSANKLYALNVLNGKVLGNSEYYIYDDYEALYVERNPDFERQDGENHIFYTSNTFLKPGDVALINGYYVGEKIDKVEICQVPDTVDVSNLTAASYGYADRKSYSSAGVLESDNISILPTAEYWNDREAIETEILQTTEKSVKFLIPGYLKKGVYAVRITYDDATSENPVPTTKTLYLNAPFVEYTIGDDGETTTAGGNLVVVGENLFPDYDKKLSDAQNLATAKRKMAVSIKDSNGNIVAENVDITKIRSVYSFNITVPNNLPVGEYELWVYSGYGDSSCWSIPFKFKVDVDLRSTFATKVYNVVDYGATSVGTQNFSPILSYACNVASENGGGIVYIPKGIYRLTVPVIVPDNVIIKGEEKETTTIIFNPFSWQVGDLPNALLYFSKNSGLQNLTIYGSRRRAPLNIVGSDAKNIYFDNVRLEFDYTSGPIGINGNSLSQNTGYLIGLARSEAGGYFLLADQAVNVRFQNVMYESFNDGFGGIMLDRASQLSKYWYFNDVELREIGWSEGCLNSSMFENTDFLYCCMGLWGDGFYYGDCQFTNNTTNNRELFVADMIPAYNGPMNLVFETDPETGKQVPKKDKNGQNTIYKTSMVSEREFLNGQVYVMAGPGDGQTRKVVELFADGTLRLDRPLAVDPGVTTLTVTIRRPRQNIYFVNNYWYNGQCGGFYSGACDVVYDGNLRQRNWRVYAWPQERDPIWYFTILNDEFVYDPYFYHSPDFSSYNSVVNSSGWDFSFYGGGARCYSYRDSVADGQHTKVAGDREAWDFLMQNVIHKNVTSTSAVYIHDNLATRADGFLLYDVILENSMDISYPAGFASAVNSTASNKLIIKLSDDGTTNLGDVTLDGVVSLKDCSAIFAALAGEIDLSDKQCRNADVDGDGKITSKDALLIKYYVTTGGAVTFG